MNRLVGPVAYEDFARRVDHSDHGLKGDHVVHRLAPPAGLFNDFPECWVAGSAPSSSLIQSALSAERAAMGFAGTAGPSKSEGVNHASLDL